MQSITDKESKIKRDVEHEDIIETNKLTGDKQLIEYDKQVLDNLAGHYEHILESVGDDKDREGLEKTPMRVANAGLQSRSRCHPKECHVQGRSQAHGSHKRY